MVIPNSGAAKACCGYRAPAHRRPSERELEVLESATDEDRKWLGTLLDANFAVELAEGVDNLYGEVRQPPMNIRPVVRALKMHIPILPMCPQMETCSETINELKRLNVVLAR